MPDDLAAALEQIRADHEAANASGPNRDDPVPRLLKAVEAVLKLADTWEAKAREIAAQISYQDTTGAVAGFKMIGVTRYQEDAKALREAITRELTGEEGSDGR